MVMMMIKRSYKLLYKTKYLFAFLMGCELFILIRIIAVLYRWMTLVEYPSADSLLYRTNEMSILYFMIFMLVSYEMNSLLRRNNISETLYLYGKAKGHISNCIVLLFYNITFTVITIFINVLGYCIKFDAKWKYIWNILCNVCLFYLLSGLLAILIGTAISHIKNRKISYILFVTIGVVLSPMMDIIGGIFYNNELFYKMKWWISFLPQGLNFVENYYIGFAVQIQKVALMILWIMSFVIVLQIIYRVRRKHYIVSGMIWMIALLGCLLPGHELAPSYRLSNWMSYAQQYYSQYDSGEMQEKYKFTVNKYDMDFSILNQLYAKVRISVEENNLPEYAFTLYHVYDIKNITDQNDVELEYIREGDYLTIVSGENPISEIVIEYAGNGIPFYSEFCGTFLKSGIAFYPVSGYHMQYADGKFLDVSSNETEFDVKVHSPKEFFCTLDKVSENEFCGKAESFTLIEGIYSVEQIEDVTFVYPTLTAFAKPIEEVGRAFIEQMDKTCEENQIDYSIHNKIVIMDIKMSAEPVASFFSDHMLVYGYQFDGFVEDKYLQDFAEGKR